MQIDLPKTKAKVTFYNKGFGLVELLVSISIMVLVIGVVTARNTAFNGASLLRGQAYDLALNIREMQLLAVSATNDKTGGTYRNVYGLVFDKDNLPNSYTIFRDDNTNNKYDASPNEVFGKQGVIDNRYQIDDIRYLGGTGGDKVTILFRRPNFDALFYNNGSALVGSVYGIEIDIRRKGTVGNGPGDIRTVEITRAGQITVK